MTDIERLILQSNMLILRALRETMDPSPLTSAMRDNADYIEMNIKAADDAARRRPR